MPNRTKIRRAKTGNVAEILTVGNEILIGHTLDTNSNWIAKRLTRHGWKTTRITTIQDDLLEIAMTLRAVLQRRPTLVFTLGGLGPTPDDMTLKGIARGLGRPLRPNRESLEMIREFYTRMGRGSVKMTVARRKMALLPPGAKPLKNTVGTAPGVITPKGPTTIISLPGVPAELKAIFNGSVTPILKNYGGVAPTETTLRIDGIVESALAPAIVKVRRAFPDLYFKSHPRRSETLAKPLIDLHIYSINEKGRQRLRAAVSMIVAELSRLSKQGKSSS